MKNINSIMIIPAAVFLAAAAAACSGQDSGKTSRDLAGKLTDSFGFEGGKKVSGEKPLEHGGDQAYPQVTGAEVPPALYAGQAFELFLYTDFTNHPDITGAVVAVEHKGVYAGAYIDVAAKVEVVDGRKRMKLNGKLGGGPGFSVEDFAVKLAMHRSDGKAGNYYTWQVRVFGTIADGGMPVYTLTAEAAGSGAVTLDPPGGSYEEGTLVTVAAVPSAAWRFDRWGGDLPADAPNPSVVAMDGNKTVTAAFMEYPPPSPGGGGDIAAIDAFNHYLAIKWTAASDAYTPEKDLEYLPVHSASGNIGTVVNALANGVRVGDWTRGIARRAVTGLAPNTLYYFNVLVRNGAGMTAAYGMKSFTTGDTPMAVTDAAVKTMAAIGTTIYIGGDFTHVGPPVPGAAILDSVDGKIPPDTLPGNIHGTVEAAAPDGAGGWYIGGKFTSVNGVPRNNLAHMTSDGVLYDWSPEPDDAVKAIAVSGSAIYVGGGFSWIGAQAPQVSRNNLAAIDAATGHALDWNPDVGGQCGTQYPEPPFVAALSLNPDGSTVFVGGCFSLVGGQTRNLLAAVNASDGILNGWNPNATGTVSMYSNQVAVITPGGTAAPGVVYVGGRFSTIGAQTPQAARNNIAAIETATGNATAWNPGPDGPVAAIIAGAAGVYAGGSFGRIGAQTTQPIRTNLAELDPSTGEATAWDPQTDGSVNSLALGGGGTVYAGGDFIYVNGGVMRSHIAAFDKSGVVTSWDPKAAGGSVKTLAVGGPRIFAGGDFSLVGGSVRTGIAAVDAVTGVVTGWDPNPNGTIYALAAYGSTLYAGGAFASIGAQSPQPARNNLAALDSATGNATAWDPNPDNGVLALAVSLDGSTVFAGGGFNLIGAQAVQPTRNYMAALEAATGNAMLWNPGPNQVVSSLSLSPDGSTLYAGGDFTILNFQPQNYLAAITASTGLPTTWKPNPGSTVYKVLATGSAVYAGGTFTTIGSQAPAPARNYIAALDPASGNATNWNPDAGSTVRSIAVSGDGETVYLGGLFGTINGATTRNNVAAVNTTTGVANGWDPDAGGEVYSILPSGPVVYTGGDFNSIGGQYRKGFAALDAATGAAR